MYLSGGNRGGSTGPSGLEQRIGMNGTYSRCSIIRQSKYTVCTKVYGVEVFKLIWACVFCGVSAFWRGRLALNS